MIIKQISKKEIKDADLFQQSVLNPNKHKRFRPFSVVYKNFLRKPSLFIGAYDKNKIIGIVFG